jgi:CubicO group peptidase (beta-lactamase class C family)
MAKFPTAEWLQELVDKLNSDENYARVAHNWEADMKVTVEAGGSLAAPIDFYLDLWHGKCRQAFILDGSQEVKPALVLRLPYENGVRLLKVGTLRRMTANFLTEQQTTDAQMMGLPVFSGQGFGLGVAVVTDPDKATVSRCKGGVGTVGWPGAYGGWWQADPTDGSVLVFLAQNAMELEQAARGIGLGVYMAISEFHALSTSAQPAAG